jgi:hypothetical protein
MYIILLPIGFFVMILFMAHMILVLLQSLSKIFRCKEKTLWYEPKTDQLFI